METTDLFDPNVVFKQHKISNTLESARRKTVHPHEWYRGSFEQVKEHVPGKFSITPFKHNGQENPLYSLIYNQDGMPVSVVSKSYSMVQHKDLVGALEKAFEKIDRNIDIYPTEVYLGDYGCKFGIRVILPDMIYDPGDDKPIAPRVEMVNSMDRTLPFRLTMGYFRFVCANGLAWGGIGGINIIKVHTLNRVDRVNISEAIGQGLGELPGMVRKFEMMNETKISDGFTSSLKENIRARWGQKEASEIDKVWKSGVYRKVRVPGIGVPVSDIWDIFNVLRWIPTRQTNLAKQNEMLKGANEVLSRTLEQYRIWLN